MAYQARVDQNSFPLILNGVGYLYDNAGLVASGTRTVALAQYTVMSQVAASGLWVPWTSDNLGAATGAQYPSGILMNDGGLTAAQCVSGLATGVWIMYMGQACAIDSSQLVFDTGPTGILAANTLASIPTLPTSLALQAEQLLAFRGFVMENVVQLDNHEN
jgi:hypothetical protein